MTTRATPRTATAVRATRRSARAVRVHTRPIPTQATRLRRGPTPPDRVIAALQRVLPGPEAAPLALPTGWLRALELAAVGVARHARRGVSLALGMGALPPEVAAAPLLPGWLEAVTAAVNAALSRSVRGDWISAPQIIAAQAAVEQALLTEHARQVQHFARAAGTPGYIWTTMQDQLVRHLHVELEGTAHRWNDPPVSGTDNFRGHPGEPARCRCQAWPYLGRI